MNWYQEKNDRHRPSLSSQIAAASGLSGDSLLGSMQSDFSHQDMCDEW
jgi:hypothetical protein